MLHVVIYDCPVPDVCGGVGLMCFHLDERRSRLMPCLHDSVVGPRPHNPLAVAIKRRDDLHKMFTLPFVTTHDANSRDDTAARVRWHVSQLNFPSAEVSFTHKNDSIVLAAALEICVGFSKEQQILMLSDRKESGQIRDNVTDRQQRPSPLVFLVLLGLRAGVHPTSLLTCTMIFCMASTFREQATTPWDLTIHRHWTIWC